MIRVYDKQLGEIARVRGLEQFEDDMVVHLHDFAPRHTEVIGDDWVRRSIRLGIERAAAYGVTNPGLLRFWVELMFMFGGLFDTDPLLPWAGGVLRDPNLPDEVARMKRLHEVMVEYLDAVYGPERSFSLQALRNLRQARFEDFPVADADFEPKALDALARIYPQRCAYLGEPPLVQLLRRAPDEATRHGMATARGIALTIGITFALGHGVVEDPLFPWVQATLHDPANKDPEKRVARLMKRTRIYLERALAYLEKRQADVRQ
jgi:hypothetical protein